MKQTESASSTKSQQSMGGLIGIRAVAMTQIINAKVPKLGKDSNAMKPITPATRRALLPGRDGSLVAVEIPVVTASSLCGNMRRLLLTDLLKAIGLERAQLATPNLAQSARVLYHTLFCGGTLGLLKELVPDFTLETEINLRQEWPMISLLGASIGSSMIRSKVAFHDLVPASRQLESHIPRAIQSVMDLQDFDPVSALVLDSDEEAYSGSRAFDSKVPVPTVGTKRNKQKEPKNGEEAGNEEADAKNKNVYREGIKPRTGYIASGTPLMGWLELDSNLTDVEYGILGRGLRLLCDRGLLGGQSHIGFGRADIQIVTGELDESAYENWLRSNQKSMVALLTGQEAPVWLAKLNA